MIGMHAPLSNLPIEFEEVSLVAGTVTMLDRVTLSLAQGAPTILVGPNGSGKTTLLAGFGRAAAEVGTVMIVGGNIDGFTRTMTTAIALETSKGDLPLAIGLGMVLIAIVILVNAAAWGMRRAGERFAG